jgi:ABC-2 type transport system ATP-binding protein
VTVTSPDVLRLEQVSKRFIIHKDKSIKERLVNFGRSRAHREDFWALNDIGFTVESGSTLGLVGHNGSGKSTLLKIIGGIIQPTSGGVWRRGRLAALLELGAGFHPDLTGRENVYLNASILGLSRTETDKHFDSIVAFSGIENFIDTQVKFYSSGMYVRLAFAVAVHVDPDTLLIDEVLAVGDEPFQRKCMEKISEFQEEGRTIVFVSHSAEQISQLCDRVIVLDHGRMAFDGAPGDGLKVLRDTFAAGLAEEADHPAGDLAITGLRLKSASYELNGDISAGADLAVEIDYRVRQAPKGWIGGIYIRNAVGQTVYWINTQGLGVEMPTGAGDCTLTVKLPHAAFGGGRHLLYADALTSTGGPLTETRAPVAFDMAPDRRGVGILQFDASGSVTSR